MCPHVSGLDSEHVSDVRFELALVLEELAQFGGNQIDLPVVAGAEKRQVREDHRNGEAPVLVVERITRERTCYTRKLVRKLMLLAVMNVVQVPVVFLPGIVVDTLGLPAFRRSVVELEDRRWFLSSNVDSDQPSGDQPSGPTEQQGWEAYRKWLSRVSMQPARRTARDASIYSWRGYNSWADKIRQNWESEDS